jgi:anaerobic C4-dicarboxylate transporter
MIKRMNIIALIIISLAAFSFVYADENTEEDNSLTIALQEEDIQNTDMENTEETKEYKTSRKYSLQIGIGLLILIALYKTYKYIKYNKN